MEGAGRAFPSRRQRPARTRQRPGGDDRQLASPDAGLAYGLYHRLRGLDVPSYPYLLRPAEAHYAVAKGSALQHNLAGTGCSPRGKAVADAKLVAIWGPGDTQ